MALQHPPPHHHHHHHPHHHHPHTPTRSTYLRWVLPSSPLLPPSPLDMKNCVTVKFLPATHDNNNNKDACSIHPVLLAKARRQRCRRPITNTLIP